MKILSLFVLMAFFASISNAASELSFPLNCETEGRQPYVKMQLWMHLHIVVLPLSEEQKGFNRVLISANLCPISGTGFCKNHKDWFYGTHKKVGSKIIVESIRADGSRLEIDVKTKTGFVILDDNDRVGRIAREVVTSSVGMKISCQ